MRWHRLKEGSVVIMHAEFNARVHIDVKAAHWIVTATSGRNRIVHGWLAKVYGYNDSNGLIGWIEVGAAGMTQRDVKRSAIIVARSLADTIKTIDKLTRSS